MKRKSYQLSDSDSKPPKYLESDDNASSSRRSSSELVRERTNFILQKLNSLNAHISDSSASPEEEKEKKSFFKTLHQKIGSLSLKITDDYLRDIGSNISLSSKSHRTKTSLKATPEVLESYNSEEEASKAQEDEDDDDEEEDEEEEQEIDIIEKTPMTITKPKTQSRVSSGKSGEPHIWSDQELLILADFIKNAKSGFLEPENWDKVVGELNRKFEEKGLDTRLTKRDLIHRLTEDIQKLKTKIQIKNKRYESAILPQPFLNQNSGPKSGEP